MRGDQIVSDKGVGVVVGSAIDTCKGISDHSHVRAICFLLVRHIESLMRNKLFVNALYTFDSENNSEYLCNKI